MFKRCLGPINQLGPDFRGLRPGQCAEREKLEEGESKWGSPGPPEWGWGGAADQRRHI